MRGDICALIVVLILGALALICLAHSQRQQPADRGVATLERLLKPRTPGDRPACRQQLALPPAARAPVPPVRPWRAVKSGRGTSKRIATDGFACPNPACAYYQITERDGNDSQETGQIEWHRCSLIRCCPDRFMH